MEQRIDWHAFWSRSATPGFHENKVNQYLEQYLPRFDLSIGDHIFVPLCGKAVDMLWLAQQGFKVTGVELSETAVRAFFEESALDFEVERYGKFKRFQSEQVTIYNGNFIDLTPSDLAQSRMVYDRASLVAIEVENRARYCQQLLRVVPGGTPMLLILLEYDQASMTGPPFSVTVDEVEHYYRANYRFSQLAFDELIEKEPRWRERGLESFRETVLMLQPW